MNESTWEILIMFLLVVANGVFVMAEIAIVSARKTRLQQWANEGSERAKKALALANHPKRFLATVQVGITLIGTLTGVYGGAHLAERLGHQLSNYPSIARWSMTIGFIIVVVAVTYLQVIIGELVPKALALGHSERLALRVAYPLDWLSRAATPLVSFLGVSTDLLLRLFGNKPSTEPPVTGEEINVMLAQGAEAGVFEESQQDMVESVIEMHERRISTLMTPRPDITWLEVGDSPDRLRDILLQSPHSRFPVCRDSLDEIIGIVHAKDLLADFLSGKKLDLEARAHKVLTIPETISVTKALEALRSDGVHMAVVIDEYGSLQGLVTLRDILESIVGELPSQGENEEPEAVQREDGSWLVDGMQAIEDFKEMTGITTLEGEDQNSWQTLGGFVMTHLGRIPKAGDHFETDGIKYEVMDMDGHRVDKVLVYKIQVKSADPPAEAQPDKNLP